MLDDAGQALSRIALREYRSTDLDAIFQLDEICFAAEFRFDRVSMRRFAEARNAIALVAEHAAVLNPKNTIAGFVIVHVERAASARHGYVVTLDVAPELRRTGVAGHMMDEAERLAVKAGASCMELHVFAGNEAAIRFYEERGYVSLGVRCGFYGGELDALVYRKLIGAN